MVYQTLLLDSCLENDIASLFIIQKETITDNKKWKYEFSCLTYLFVCVSEITFNFLISYSKENNIERVYGSLTSLSLKIVLRKKANTATSWMTFKNAAQHCPIVSQQVERTELRTHNQLRAS